MASAKDKREKEDERRRKLALQKKYANRLQMVKNAKEYREKGDLSNSVLWYKDYLQTMADLKEVEMYKLSPTLFDEKQDTAEMIMISQIFWELAKVYDMTPKFHGELANCLDRFVEFTVNQKWQVLNAEGLRKFLKKSRINNKASFQEAYQKIIVKSDKCFVASYSFGNNHSVTRKLRGVKTVLNTSSVGRQFISTYYRYSPRLLERLRAGRFQRIHTVIRWTLERVAQFLA